MPRATRDPIIRMTFRNSLVHWRYSVATVLIVGIGLLSIWTFRGYMLRVEEMYRDHFMARSMFGDLLIENAQADVLGDLSTALTKPQQDQIQSFIQEQGPQIAQVVRFLNVEGQINVGTEASIFNGVAYDVQAGEAVRGRKWRWNAVAGRPLKGPSEVLLGRNMAQLLGCTYDSGNYLQRLGDGPGYREEERPFHCGDAQQPTPKAMINISTERGQLNASYFSIAGLTDVGYRDIDRTWLMLSMEDGQRLLATDKISWVSVNLADHSQAAAVSGRFNEFAKTAGLPLRAQVWSDHRFTDMYRRTMSLLSVFEAFVLSILTGIVGIAVFNLMVKIVQERRREIGLLRTIGYRSHHLLRLFLGESLLNAMAGVTLGVLASWLFTAVVNHLGVLYRAGVLSESVAFSIALQPSTGLWTSLQLVTIALAASFFAMFKTLREEVIDCLIG